MTPLPLAAQDPARPILLKFKEMAAIYLREDLSDEECGRLLRERFPREKLEPFMKEATRVQEALQRKMDARPQDENSAKA